MCGGGGGGGTTKRGRRRGEGGQIRFYFYKNKWGGGVGGGGGFSHAEVLRDFINTEHLRFSHAEGGWGQRVSTALKGDGVCVWGGWGGHRK